jgi:hypothetical protein
MGTYFQSYLPATCFGSYNWSQLQAELLRLVCKSVCLLVTRSCITIILQNCGIKYTIHKLEVVLETFIPPLNNRNTTEMSHLKINGRMLGKILYGVGNNDTP